MDWLEKLPEFLKMSWSDFSKVMIGVFLTGFLSLSWARTAIKRARDKVAAAKEQSRLEVEVAKANARADVEAARHEASKATVEQANRHTADVLGIQQAMVDLRHSEMKATTERDDLLKRHAGLESQLADLKSFDGKLWDRPLLVEPPLFVPAPGRKTRFLAVANLKGGVGKTTVAANAGAALAKRGSRVLLVDLDFQGSLTRLCIGFTALKDLVKKGETVSALLGLNNGGAGDWLTRVIRPVNGVKDAAAADAMPGAGQQGAAGALDFIPAFDDLADVELREEARWFVTREPDVRFLFRRLIHTPAILDRYDYVFFDCPPRLTTAGVNALACADGLLIPVTLDQQSVQAIPRTLRWLQRLPQVSQRGCGGWSPTRCGSSTGGRRRRPRTP
jgi:cellulose biosynthesis protein BcsQ